MSVLNFDECIICLRSKQIFLFCFIFFFQITYQNTNKIRVESIYHDKKRYAKAG